MPYSNSKCKGAEVMTIGEKISKLRKENNYTQEQLADILNVSRQSVSKWESNTAYPETDKLIVLARLFECSTDYLLKDECTCKNGDFEKSIDEGASVEAEYPSRNQKVIGYILLAVSLIAGILIFLLAESEEELYVPIPFVISALTCSLICLFVRYKAAYWCVWAIVAPLVLFTPHIVGWSALNGINLVLICFYVTMFFVARKLFANFEISVSKKKSILVAIGWIALIGLRIFSYISATSTVINSAIGLFPYMLMNLSVFVGIALLLTYTVCYSSNLKRWKK